MRRLTILLLMISLWMALARRCDLGPSDVMFVVHFTNMLTVDQMDDVKRFMRDLVAGFEISPKDVRVGAIVYDNSQDPVYALTLGKAKNLEQLETGLMTLQPAPCGFAFCKLDPSKTLTNAVNMALSILGQETNPKRMKKVIVVQTGAVRPGEIEAIQSIQSSDPWLRIAQIHIARDEDNPSTEYSEYLNSYYQPYERYLSRMRQLYPNMTIPSMRKNYHKDLPQTRTINGGVVTISGFDVLCTVRSDMCGILFACPPCISTASSVDDRQSPIQVTASTASSIDDLPLPKTSSQEDIQEPPPSPFDNLPWPSSLSSPSPSTSTAPPASKPFDAYEYEISGDPPGLTINNTPVSIKDKRKSIDSSPSSQSSSTSEDPESSNTLDFEDIVDSIPIRENSSASKKVGVVKDELKSRKKRAIYSTLLQQSQCYCGPAPSGGVDPTAVRGGESVSFPQPLSAPPTMQQSPCCGGCLSRYVPYYCRGATPPSRCPPRYQLPCQQPPASTGSWSDPNLLGKTSSSIFRPSTIVEPNGVKSSPFATVAPSPSATLVPGPSNPFEPVSIPTEKYAQLPLPSAVNDNEVQVEQSTDISDWAAKFSKQIEEAKGDKNDDIEYEEFAKESPGTEDTEGTEDRKQRSDKRELTDFEKEYDYEAITDGKGVIKAKKSIEEMRQGWKKLMTTNKTPRRIENDKHDPLLDALSVLRPTPPSIESILSAFQNVHKAVQGEVHHKPSERTTTRTVTLPSIAFESRRAALSVDDVIETRTKPTELAVENFKGMEELERELEGKARAEGRLEKEKETLTVFTNGARNRRMLSPPSEKVQLAAEDQKKIERQKVAKELARLGKFDSITKIFQDNHMPKTRKSLPSPSSCRLQGVDIVFLIDDTSTLLSKTVEGLYDVLEDIHDETMKKAELCHTRSRIAIIAVSPGGANKLIETLDQSTFTPFERPICGEEEERCEKSLSEGLVLAVNLLTQAMSDRRKAVIVVSGRSEKRLQMSSSSLAEALQLAISLGVDVLPIEMAIDTELSFVSTFTAGGLRPLHWQDGASGQLGLRNALCATITVSDEELREKQPFCPWNKTL